MKLLVSDFDGTYFTDDINIKKNNQKIKEFRKNGNLFMLSSGRSYNSLKKMCIKYNIEYDYLSCGDGSILYDNNDNIVIKFNLNNDILDKFLSLKDLVKFDSIHYSYPDDYYNEYLDDNLIGLNLVVQNSFINTNFLNQFNILKNNYQNFDFLDYTHNGITFFCLKNKGINKSSTIKFLQKKLNLETNDIYTIGDNENDYEMLKLFQGFYIGNVSLKIQDVCIKGYNQVFEFFNERD